MAQEAMKQLLVPQNGTGSYEIASHAMKWHRKL